MTPKYCAGAIKTHSCRSALPKPSLIGQSGRVRRSRAQGLVVAAASVSCALTAAFVVGVLVGRSHEPPRSVAPNATTTVPCCSKSLPGMTVVSDGHGPVGYAPTASLMPQSRRDFMAVNARTLVRVTNMHGVLVGYEAQAVGFVPLSVARKPDFDVEALRAAGQGGCEPQIGNPNFKQEFPRCRQ
jgi:hypothetical protein